MQHRPENPPDDETLIRADPKLRRRLALLVLVFAILGAGLILALQQHLERIVQTSAEEPRQAMARVFGLLRLSTGVAGCGLIAFSLFLARFSARVLAEKRFPPAGTKVLRDTRVLTGPAASHRAWLGLVLSLLLLLAGLFVPWFPDLVIRPLVYDSEFEVIPEVIPGTDPQPTPRPSGAPASSEPELQAALGAAPGPGRGEAAPGPRRERSCSTAS